LNDVSNTIEFRLPVDANVNDIQPIDFNTIFVLGHDGALWLETGPFGDIDQTIQTRTAVYNEAIAFEAVNTDEVYILDGNQQLWLASSPFSKNDYQLVDYSVNACYPLWSESLLGARTVQSRPAIRGGR